MAAARARRAGGLGAATARFPVDGKDEQGARDHNVTTSQHRASTEVGIELASARKRIARRWRDGRWRGRRRCGGRRRGRNGRRRCGRNRRHKLCGNPARNIGVSRQAPWCPVIGACLTHVNDHIGAVIGDVSLGRVRIVRSRPDIEAIRISRAHARHAVEAARARREIACHQSPARDAPIVDPAPAARRAFADGDTDAARRNDPEPVACAARS